MAPNRCDGPVVARVCSRRQQRNWSGTVGAQTCDKVILFCHRSTMFHVRLMARQAGLGVGKAPTLGLDRSEVQMEAAKLA